MWPNRKLLDLIGRADYHGRWIKWRGVDSCPSAVGKKEHFHVQ